MMCGCAFVLINKNEKQVDGRTDDGWTPVPAYHISSPVILRLR